MCGRHTGADVGDERLRLLLAARREDDAAGKAGERLGRVHTDARRRACDQDGRVLHLALRVRVACNHVGRPRGPSKWRSIRRRFFDLGGRGLLQCDFGFELGLSLFQCRGSRSQIDRSRINLLFLCCNCRVLVRKLGVSLREAGRPWSAHRRRVELS